MSNARRPEQRALARLIAEMSREPAPELDWQRMEARLLQQPKAEANAETPFLKRLRWPALGLAAAVAATVVLARRQPTPAPPLAHRAVAPTVQGPMNGDQVAVGTHLTAGASPLVIEHAGRASWTLEPRGTAVLTQTGDSITLRLESGAMTARVVPTPKPETFAVEVSGTRVAVHGTEFRVERAGDRVLVSVMAGTVAVEPTGTHSTPSFLLRRDSRGSFGLDGRTGSVEGNASALVTDHPAQSHREFAVKSPVSQPHARSTATAARAVQSEPTLDAAGPSPLPAQPSISNIEGGVSAAVVLMNRCFRDQTPTKGIAVSARTGLTLSVGGDGTVKSATFEPPLAPAVEDCAVKGLRALTFAESIEGVTFTRILDVSR